MRPVLAGQSAQVVAGSKAGRVVSAGRAALFVSAGRAALILTALAAACGTGSRQDGQPSPAPTGGEVAPSRLEAAYRARADSTRARFTDADVRFMTDMIAHHGQAIVMAGLAPERDASPPVRNLAVRILDLQRDEIAYMQGWLRERGQPAPEAPTDAAAWHSHAFDPGTLNPGMLAPGMLTGAQLRALADSRAADFDQLFLLFMIQHHRGAIEMVRDLFATHGAAQDHTVSRLAADIEASQRAEITLMARMLVELSAGRRPPR